MTLVDQRCDGSTLALVPSRFVALPARFAWARYSVSSDPPVVMAEHR